MPERRSMDTAYKKVTSHGSISIPVGMRRDLGIEPKDPMTVEAKGGKIIISPYTLRCIFCGAGEGVQEFRGRGICRECAAKIMEETEGGK